MTTASDLLFSPLALGPLSLPNRLVMAPMTRCRAEGHVPTELHARYYEQRASAGLIITEATQVSPQGIGYLRTPGIHTDAQVEGWRLVTDAVHRAGGRIFAQLWHVGRASHVSFQPNRQAPLSSSAVAIRKGHAHTPEGPQPYSTPRALEIDEIPGVVAQFEHGARQAKAAGFDGVELHAANGYIIDQFLRDGVNRRTDRYGGSVQNRARFLLEITDAVTAVFGADRVGVRVSPRADFNDMSDSDPKALFGHVAAELSARKIGYLHVVEAISAEPPDAPERVSPLLRDRFRGAFMANGGYTRETAERALRSGAADLVSFGAPFLANPDLPERLRRGAPLNAPDVATFYSDGPRGFVDYPRLGEAQAASAAL
ncbi:MULTISPECIES: alkene reductase [Sorangium]|uniref:12-oxophytodienoate reductase n=1 Tax=Sorangium cellulosum TaxID=56 RepID=A0A4V0NHL3_SORCE|nr:MULTISPECIES: alkene reductase [Sorangium]AUX37072.1 12-oxophytodienoate reductase [Sorangium cellulosum]WCQ96365.1 N-ethylmaleimide reductase [Sorangium sp. Soce836]